MNKPSLNDSIKPQSYSKFEKINQGSKTKKYSMNIDENSLAFLSNSRFEKPEVSYLQNDDKLTNKRNDLLNDFSYQGPYEDCDSLQNTAYIDYAPCLVKKLKPEISVNHEDSMVKKEEMDSSYLNPSGISWIGKENKVQNQKILQDAAPEKILQDTAPKILTNHEEKDSHGPQ